MNWFHKFFDWLLMPEGQAQAELAKTLLRPYRDSNPGESRRFEQLASQYRLQSWSYDLIERLGRELQQQHTGEPPVTQLSGSILQLSAIVEQQLLLLDPCDLIQLQSGHRLQPTPLAEVDYAESY